MRESHIQYKHLFHPETTNAEREEFLAKYSPCGNTEMSRAALAGDQQAAHIIWVSSFEELHAGSSFRYNVSGHRDFFVCSIRRTFVTSDDYRKLVEREEYYGDIDITAPSIGAGLMIAICDLHYWEENLRICYPSIGAETPKGKKRTLVTSSPLGRKIPYTAIK